MKGKLVTEAIRTCCSLISSSLLLTGVVLNGAVIPFKLQNSCSSLIYKTNRFINSFYVLQNFVFTRDGADCEESDLLRATLGSSPLESIYFSIKNSRANNLMNYSPLSAHLRSINTHVRHFLL